MFIEGKRVYLRPMEKSDLPNLVRWFNDPQVMKFLGRRYPMSAVEEEAWLNTVRDPLKQGVAFMVVVKGKTPEKDRPIGTMGLHNIEIENGIATTGAAFGEKDCWGKGYGEEAKMLLLDWAFGNLRLHKIYSRVMANNPRSRRYSEKCGYVLEATLPSHFFRNGERVDEWILAVYADEWRKLWEKNKHTFIKK